MQEKDIKHQKTVQLFSNNISEIWLLMMLFKQQNTIVTIINYTGFYRQQFLSCLNLPKSVGNIAILSIPSSKIFTVVSCSCLTVVNFAIFMKNIQA